MRMFSFSRRRSGFGEDLQILVLSSPILPSPNDVDDATRHEWGHDGDPGRLPRVLPVIPRPRLSLDRTGHEAVLQVSQYPQIQANSASLHDSDWESRGTDVSIEINDASPSGSTIVASLGVSSPKYGFLPP